MKAILVLLFFVYLLDINSYAGTRKKTGKVFHEKGSISGLLRDLGLYIASEQEFVRDSNKGLIQKKMGELSDLFKVKKNHPELNYQGLVLNQVLMGEQLDQAVSLFKNGQRPLARTKFNAVLSLCVSCHTQTFGGKSNGKNKIFADSEIDKLKINDYEKAELYFITRDFESAIKLYDKFIRSSKKTDDDEFIYKALERQLVYFLKIKKSFPHAKTHFESYIRENILNDKIAREIGEWVKSLSGKSLWEQYDPATVKEEDMEKFMKTFIADDEEGPIFSLTNSSEVYDINLSAILVDYYNAHPETKLGAKILYWLATLDKRINDDLFFSLGDFYLFSCMEKYPKDPIAKDCYESYLDDLEINYMKDKDFPPEVEAKLNKFQKLINYQEEE